MRSGAARGAGGCSGAATTSDPATLLVGATAAPLGGHLWHIVLLGAWPSIFGVLCSPNWCEPAAPRRSAAVRPVASSSVG
ncbi:MAG TPA: hypothetical protein VNF07_10465 [Acidimicrobiales bacterium]|nr:hypothetical protein [Acidimicrobiales bacterium]